MNFTPPAASHSIFSPGKWVGAAVLGASMLAWGGAAAQSDAAIAEVAMREPWVQQLAVLQSLSVPITNAEMPVPPELVDALAGLETAIGDYEERVDRVIDRLAADPQFAYSAAKTSLGLADRLTDAHDRFDKVYAILGVPDRPDVIEAQASLARLRDILQEHTAFEDDVMRALGAGSRTQIIALATRWWNGEERAIAVKKLVAELRQTIGR